MEGVPVPALLELVPGIMPGVVVPGAAVVPGVGGVPVLVCAWATPAASRASRRRQRAMTS